MKDDQRQHVSLEKETENTVREARVVLPGIQTLFGFQLIAVFNHRFTDLTTFEQYLHLGALVLVAVAVALIMAPAAYHRIADRGVVSRHFVDLASRYIAAALVPLMLGIDFDVYLVCRLVTGSTVASVAIAAGVLALFAMLWFVLPWRHSRLHSRTARA